MKVKICGITRAADAEAAEAAGADAIGLIFAEASRRRVGIVRAREISGAVGPFLTRVGVFADASAEAVLEAVDGARLDVVQLHGDVPGATLDALRGRVRIVRAVRFEPGLLPDRFAGQPYDGVLLDGPRAGSGRSFDWSAASASWRGHPRLLLAGGLRPETVGEAVRVLRPHGVDVASGVEVEPGVKDAAALRRFVAAARAVEPAA